MRTIYSRESARLNHERVNAEYKNYSKFFNLGWVSDPVTLPESEAA